MKDLKRLYALGIIKNLGEVLKYKQVLAHNLLDHHYMMSPKFRFKSGKVAQSVQSHWGTNPDNQWESLKQWHFTLNLN